MKRFRAYAGGFTLIEMLLAIAIFILLAGGVYIVISVSVSAATTLGDDQIEARRMGAFQDFLRRGFRNLPAEAEITLRARTKGPLGQGLELVIRPAAGAFEVGTASGSLGGGVVLAVLPDGKGKSRFSIARFPSKLSEDERNKYLADATWLPMLEDVDTVRWRFWDKNLLRFEETWDRGAEHPELIELTFGVRGEPPQTCLFRLPTLATGGVRQ